MIVSCDGVLQGFSESEIACARAAFSNLIGGISYFYGQSKLDPKNQNHLNFRFAPIFRVTSKDLDKPVVSQVILT